MINRKGRYPAGAPRALGDDVYGRQPSRECRRLVRRGTEVGCRQRSRASQSRAARSSSAFFTSRSTRESETTLRAQALLKTGSTSSPTRTSTESWSNYSPLSLTFPAPSVVVPNHGGPERVSSRQTTWCRRGNPNADEALLLNRHLASLIQVGIGKPARDLGA